MRARLGPLPFVASISIMRPITSTNTHTTIAYRTDTGMTMMTKPYTLQTSLFFATKHLEELPTFASAENFFEIYPLLQGWSRKRTINIAESERYWKVVVIEGSE